MGWAVQIRGDHSGRFKGILEAVLCSVSVVKTVQKWLETVLNCDHPLVKMFSMAVWQSGSYCGV